MSNPRDESSQESPPDPASGPTTDDQSVDNGRSGRIAYDERGSSVWEWQLETGVYSRDLSTQRLKKLDLNDLSIAETATHPRPPGLTDPPGPESLPGSGSNLYDNSTTGDGKVANHPYNSAERGALKQAPPARKPLDSTKQEEWLELRKRVEQNKREDGDD